VLGVFGLGVEEEDVYRYVLATKRVTAADLQAGMGMPLDRAQGALARLEEAGFTYRDLEDPVRYAAASPSAVDATILRKLADLRADHVEPDARVRGRVVYDRALVKGVGVLDAIRERPGRHYEVRVHALVPVKLLAIDRSIALLPVQQHDETPVGMLITESAVLDSFLALFEYVWETATTLPPVTEDDAGDTGRSPLRAVDRQLLSLLLAGLTDQAIAGHYRVSVRTIERRVRALMDAAHVRTRTQLAWEAARQHWL
jgi:DNA-binding CsgD family transcriptional regulator